MSSSPRGARRPRFAGGARRARCAGAALAALGLASPFFGLASPAVSGPPAAAPANPVAPQPASGLRLVVLDPGHGGPNEGAPARFDPGAFEKTYTLDIAERIAAQLRAAGVEVVLTRANDLPLDLQARVQIANRLGADVFVSVHLNSTEKPGPVGHESFILSVEATDEGAARLARFENAEGAILAHLSRPAGAGLDPAGTASAGEPPTATPGEAADPAGSSGTVDDVLADLAANRAHRDAERLAAAVQARVTPRSPFPNRGVKQAPFGVLKGAAMPAIVFEGGFLNHKDEGRWVISEAGRAALAEGVALGILDFGQTVLARRRGPSAP